MLAYEEEFEAMLRKGFRMTCNGAWYVYMVRCKNNALYTGITTDIEARIEKHNTGKGSKAVRMLGLPVKLVHKETFETKSEALKREAAIKKLSKKKKEKLMKP